MHGEIVHGAHKEADWKKPTWHAHLQESAYTGSPAVINLLLLGFEMAEHGVQALSTFAKHADRKDPTLHGPALQDWQLSPSL